MSDTVWVVTAGEYSDYHIRRIFSNQGAAEAYASTFPKVYNDEATVEEWPLDGAFDPNRVSWKVELCDHYTPDVERHEELPEGQAPHHVTFDAAEWARSGDRVYTVWVQAANREAAIKIAAEKVAQFRAEQEGIA